VNGAISRMFSGRSWYLSAKHGVRQLVVVGLEEEEGVSRRWGVRRFLCGCLGVWGRFCTSRLLGEWGKSKLEYFDSLEPAVKTQVQVKSNSFSKAMQRRARLEKSRRRCAGAGESAAALEVQMQVSK
jgi:hypothetical protein